ncbi:hypothetical protein DITRI_Ditri13aG0155000 [Diplodiscus trichospermus]
MSASSHSIAKNEARACDYKMGVRATLNELTMQAPHIIVRGMRLTITNVALPWQKWESHRGVEEFQNKALLLCQLRHPHLVSLLGFCDEQNEMILVYEYMSRGSLSDYLFGKTYDPLCWKQRLKICIGVARGLHYLHTGAKRAVFHCDIKSSNILLDEEGSSKISDFALSKLMGPLSKSKPLRRMESIVVGTYGYMAPEYAVHRELTEKADVFSFGVVLFEVLCGRKFCNRELPGHLLIDWASEFIREETIYHVTDPYLQGNIAPDCFKKYLEIACSCVQCNRHERYGEVEVTLELALELQEKADSEMEGINISHGEYQLTRKSDVYSFGVVLFEVLCGRKKKEIAPGCFKIFMEVAYGCICETGNGRPESEMGEVEMALEVALELQKTADAKR